MTKGLVPPHNLDIEESVLGAIINQSHCIDDVLSILPTSEAFYNETNRLIFEAIQNLFKKSEPIDLITICDELRKLKKLDDVGGEFGVISIAQKVVSSAHVEYHSRLLQQMMMRRMIVRLNHQITAAALDEGVDVFDLLKRWSNEFDKVNDLMITGRKSISFPESLKEVQQQVEYLSNKKDGEITGIDTGFARINRFTNGYQPGHLIIVAARPGMGKTAKVLRTALENLKHGAPVGMISIEMPFLELSSRMVALDTNFHLSQLIRDGFDKNEYFTTLSDNIYRMAKYPFYVNDGNCSDIVDVVAQARLWKRQFGIKLLIIDYLQLMSDKTKGNNREQEISSISRRMKLLAKELDLPIVLLSQLSREVEKRTDKRPRLSDLRESGAIEQDADVVEFIYRPGYYNIEIDDEDMISEGSDTEIIFAKNRHGSLGTGFLKWIGDKTKFADPTDYRDRKYFYNTQGYGPVAPATPEEAFGTESVF